MDKIISITIDGDARNVTIVPEHWNNDQSEFEHADVYLVLDATNEQRLATICFTEDKQDWEINSKLDIEAEYEIVNYIKSQSPLTSL